MKKNGRKSANIQSVCNIISSIIISGTNFITMPIYTRLLGAEQYGMYSLFNSWLTIFLCFFGLKNYSSIGPAFYKYGLDYQDFKKSVFIFGCMDCMVTGLAICFFKNELSRYLGISINACFLLAILAGAHYIIDFSNAAWIYEKAALKNLAISTTLIVLSNMTSLLCIQYNPFHMQKYENRILGIVIIYGLVSMALAVMLMHNNKSRVNKKYCIYGFSFGMPVVLHSLSQTILAQSDRIMMQNMGVSSATIGVYSFYYTYTAITNVILVALNNSWMPFLYDELNGGNYDILENRMYDYAELFTTIMAGFILLSREISYIFANSEYKSGISIIPLIAASIYFTFLYQFPVNYEFYLGKPKIVAIGTTISASVNIILNYFFIINLEMYGAALATCISYAILFIIHMTVVYNWKEEKYPVSSKFMIKNTLLIVIACIAFYIFKSRWYIRWSIGIFMGVYILYKIYKRKTVF